MNLELLVLDVMTNANGSLSHFDLTHQLGQRSLDEGEPLMICEAWDLIEDAKNAGYLRDEWRNAFSGGTLWHLTEKGKVRYYELKGQD